jgi:hypothetical protein
MTVAAVRCVWLFVGFSDDRGIELVVSFGLVALILLIIVVGVSRGIALPVMVPMPQSTGQSKRSRGGVRSCRLLLDSRDLHGKMLARCRRAVPLRRTTSVAAVPATAHRSPACWRGP